MVHRVVIVGGGFGGLEAAKRLDDDRVEITLIDRRNHHLFQPLLYQVATAGLSPADIAHPIRSILGGQRNVRVLLGDVAAVDLDPAEVVLDDGDRVPYDSLVLAAGARHAYFGRDDWEVHAPGLKSVEDALEIRRRVLAAFEAAERDPDPSGKATKLTFVVVGAGPTGVEMAGAIAEIATRTLSGEFRTIDPSTARVVLVEGLDRVLSSFHPDLSARAVDQLRDLGVDVLTATRVVGLDGGGVDLDGPDGSARIDAMTVVWGAGVAASSLGATLGVELDRAGRVAVDSSLAVAGHPNVFVIGDMAAARSRGAPVPGVAPAAVQGGRHVASTILGDLDGRSRHAFRYRDKGSLATIGRSRAVAEFGRLRFSGFSAWVLWWAVHIALLIGFRSRVLVMFGWGWNWMTFKRGARLITRRWTPGNE